MHPVHVRAAPLLCPSLTRSSGLILSDLTFIEDGNPDRTSDGLIHWQKRVLLFTVLSSLLEQQRKCSYRQLQTPFLSSVLASIRAHQITADEHYGLSLKIEPRGQVPADFQEPNSLLTTLKRLGELASVKA